MRYLRRKFKHRFAVVYVSGKGFEYEFSINEKCYIHSGELENLLVRKLSLWRQELLLPSELILPEFLQ